MPLQAFASQIKKASRMKDKKSNCGCLSKYMKTAQTGTKGSKGRNGWDAKPVFRITNPGRR